MAVQKDAFLTELAETASVTAACRASGVGRRTVYDWRAADETFAAAWDKAIEQATDALEDEAVRRALEGTEEPIFYRGERVGRLRKVSDSLLMFLLKARRPERFQDRGAAATKGHGDLVERLARARARVSDGASPASVAADETGPDGEDDG